MCSPSWDNWHLSSLLVKEWEETVAHPRNQCLEQCLSNQTKKRILENEFRRYFKGRIYNRDKNNQMDQQIRMLIKKRIVNTFWQHRTFRVKVEFTIEECKEMANFPRQNLHFVWEVENAGMSRSEKCWHWDEVQAAGSDDRSQGLASQLRTCTQSRIDLSQDHDRYPRMIFEENHFDPTPACLSLWREKSKILKKKTSVKVGWFLDPPWKHPD